MSGMVIQRIALMIICCVLFLVKKHENLKIKVIFNQNSEISSIVVPKY